MPRKTKLLNIILFASFTLVLFLLLLLPYCEIPSFKVEEAKPKLVVDYRAIDSIKEIVPIQDTLVPPIVYTNTISLQGLPIEQKKQKFIDMMLPAVLVTQYRIEKNRNRIIEIHQKMLNKESIPRADSVFVYERLKMYNAETINDLIERLKPHPTSIVLAQGALESGWGTSRFFLKANNIFGIWSFNPNDKRIRASHSRGTRAIYLKKYDNISQGIFDYYKTLARVSVYKEFRKKRLDNNDPLELIPYLYGYSELGEVYISRLRKVIKYNNLTKYDAYRIDPVFIVNEPK
ncbi:MAG: glucosaminidase domain-containing protein [Bacteroidales bacterium]|nr:glucosaminidase domain-containing protein [Bacteroidales bacterium]